MTQSLNKILKRLKSNWQKLTVNLTDSAKMYIADQGFDPIYGGGLLRDSYNVK
ncbi:hypothetical protein [Niameybacter sp.]|uniref:hypothetical protein n=1 Tax=Niameybacter sp. TaxID=2033640 RepID=UPI003FA57612